MNRLLLTAVLLLGAPLVPPPGYPAPAAGPPTTHDVAFKWAARRACLGLDWRLLKHQCWWESHFRAEAVSSAGAKGLCQLMPATFRQEAGRLGLRNALRRNVRDNVRVAASYDCRLRAFWHTPRSRVCRDELMLASYNAGAGNILRAQVESGGRLCWDGIAPHLHRVTGSHAEETRAYVSRIQRTRLQELLGG